MQHLVLLFSHNDTLVAMGVFASIFCLLALIANWLRPAFRYFWVAATLSIRVAERRRSFQRALLAYRCAEEPSYLIATIMQDVALRLLLLLAAGNLTALGIMQETALGSSATIFDRLFTLVPAAMIAVSVLSFISRYSSLGQRIKRIIHSRKVADGGKALIWKRPKFPVRIIPNDVDLL